MHVIDLSLDQLTHFYVHFGTTLFLVLVLLLSFRLLAFFFFSPPSSSIPRSLSPESLSSIYRETEKEQYKNVQNKTKMRRSQSDIKKKKETQLREKNEQWNATQNRERTCLLPDSHRNRFLREGLSLSCPPCNRISGSERCAIRCYFQQEH